MKNTKTNKQGVSLIVLVITIIVMIILAGTIILSLDNNGIIGKAQEAINKTNLAEVQNLAQLAWAEAYLNNVRTDEGLTAAVMDALEKQEITEEDYEGYTIKVTTSGVTVTKKPEATAWRQEGLKVTNGIMTAEIGDTVNYVSGANAEIDYEDVPYEQVGTWKILGVENGQLLLMSARSVIDNEDGGTYLDDYGTLANHDDYCKRFGSGTYGAGARLVKMEDINKVTGYNPRNVGVYDPLQTGSGKIYGQGTIEEYGVTYTYTVTEKDGEPIVEYIGTNGVEGTINMEEYWDEPLVVTNAAYYYNVETLTDNSEDEKVGIPTSSKAYELLFTSESETGNSSYWINSTCDNVFLDRDIVPGLFTHGAGGFGVDNAENIIGCGITNGLRAVVYLEPDVLLTSNGTDSWKISKPVEK